MKGIDKIELYEHAENMNIKQKWGTSNKNSKKKCKDNRDLAEFGQEIVSVCLIINFSKPRSVLSAKSV